MRRVTGLLATMLLSAGLPTIAGDCPAAVTSAVEKAHPGAKRLACNSEREKGTTLYEVKIHTTNGKKLELEVRPDGAILLSEEHIATSEVPAAAMQTLHTKFADATVKEAERLTAADGKISFEVTFTSGGRLHSMTVTEAGTLVDIEEEGNEKDGKDEKGDDDEDD